MPKSAIQIIREAYAYAGIVPTAVPLNAEMSQEGLGFLNELLYAWNTENYFPFTSNTIDGRVSGGQAKISPDEGSEFIGEKPIYINQVLYKNGTVWTSLRRLSYEKIWEHRSQCCLPTFFAFTNDSDGNGIIVFDCENGNFDARVIYNKDIPPMEYSTILAAPPQYEQLLKYGVAAKVCTRYGVPQDKTAGIVAERDAMLSNIKKVNSPKHSIILSPRRDVGAYDDHAIQVLSGRVL